MNAIAVVRESETFSAPLLEHCIDDLWIEALIERGHLNRRPIGERCERLNYPSTHGMVTGERDADVIGHGVGVFVHLVSSLLSAYIKPCLERVCFNTYSKTVFGRPIKSA